LVRKPRELNDKHRKTRSFRDYFIDRWEMAKELGFGEGVTFFDGSLVFGDCMPERIRGLDHLR
jgi:hypothetical protein